MYLPLCEQWRIKIFGKKYLGDISTVHDPLSPIWSLMMSFV